MAKKRGQGEGSISKREDGIWWARITVGYNANGQQKRKAFYGRTRKEVQQKMTEALNEVNKGTYVESSKMPVSEWFDCWLKDYKKAQVKNTTYVNYCGKVKNHILPAIGNYRLCDLKPEIIQKAINKLVLQGLSPETIRGINNIMHDAFKMAAKNGLIVKNVASGMVLPKIDKSEAKAFTVDEQKRFVEIAKDTYMGEVLLLALGTGLRIGEILALTWDDIDFVEQILRVKRTMSVVKDYDDTEARWEKQFGTPKTKSSIRSVPLLPNIIDLLNQVSKKQAKNKLKAGSAYEEHKLVFSTLIGRPLDHRNLQRTFKTILEKANITGKFSIHSLRHTFATRGLESGIELRVMQELLGHANIGITAGIYIHVLPDNKRESMMKLESAINF